MTPIEQAAEALEHAIAWLEGESEPVVVDECRAALEALRSKPDHESALSHSTASAGQAATVREGEELLLLAERCELWARQVSEQTDVRKGIRAAGSKLAFDLRAAIARALAEKTPESVGWQMVPTSPTREMCAAGAERIGILGSGRGGLIDKGYQAMLSAAPLYSQPEAGGPKSDKDHLGEQP